MERLKSVDFSNTVHQNEPPPLYIHFAFGAQDEAVHAFMHTDLGEDRLDNAGPPGVNFLTHFAVNLGPHLVNQIRRLAIHLNKKIPARSSGLAQTARPQRTGSAVFGAGVIDVVDAKAVGLIAGVTFQRFPVRILSQHYPRP
jgi:hypothetical protein